VGKNLLARSQSSLLESMEEGQVTVDGVTLDLPGIFTGRQAPASEGCRRKYLNRQSNKKSCW